MERSTNSVWGIPIELFEIMWYVMIRFLDSRWQLPCSSADAYFLQTCAVLSGAATYSTTSYLKSAIMSYTWPIDTEVQYAVDEIYK